MGARARPAPSTSTCSPSARSSAGACRSPRSAAARTSWTCLAPLGPVYQAGTLSGNPLAVAAGLATLRAADAEVYARVDAAADRVVAAVGAALDAEGVEHAIARAGNLFSVAFGLERRPAGLRRGPRPGGAGGIRAFFHAMLEQGVSLPPSVFEAWFLTAAHDDAALSRVEEALPGRRPGRRSGDARPPPA